MPIQMRIKIGDYEVAASGKDEREVIESLSFFSQCPRKCGHCDSDKIGFIHVSPQDYDYYMMKCQDCGWEFKFGIRQSDERLFPKPDKDSEHEGWVAPFKKSGDRDADADRQPRRESRRDDDRSERRQPPRRREKDAAEEEDEDKIPFD